MKIITNDRPILCDVCGTRHKSVIALNLDQDCAPVRICLNCTEKMSALWAEHDFVRTQNFNRAVCIANPHASVDCGRNDCPKHGSGMTIVENADANTGLK